MTEHKITKFFSNAGTRNEVRMRVVNVLSIEKPGTGSGDLASRYTYYVETISDGNRIYLRRPANLHNGFDFLVCIENYNFSDEGKRNRNYPKHEDIVKDLLLKKRESIDLYKKLFSLIEDTYYCRRDVTGSDFNELKFNEGYPADFILKSLKWLFIEQDIRYWNYSGRGMLWEGLKDLK